MDVDKFTKFLLSIIAFSLCLIALNPWISPTLANAEAGGAMALIAQDIKKIAGAIESIEKHGIAALVKYNDRNRITRVKASKKEKQTNDLFRIDDLDIDDDARYQELPRVYKKVK